MVYAYNTANIEDFTNIVIEVLNQNFLAFHDNYQKINQFLKKNIHIWNYTNIVEIEQQASGSCVKKVQ